MRERTSIAQGPLLARTGLIHRMRSWSGRVEAMSRLISHSHRSRMYVAMLAVLIVIWGFGAGVLQLPRAGVAQSTLVAGIRPFDYRLLVIWCIAILSAMVISAYLAMPYVRRAHRLRSGLCVVCGYDLVGIGKLRRCPECGHRRFVNSHGPG